MKIEFTKTKMKLANVNPRAELHGEEREPAGDLKLEVDCPSEVLANFHPALRSLLYYHDERRQRDLADQGSAQDKNFAPDLRMPLLGSPLKWEEEMLGASVTLCQPGSRSAIALEGCAVNNFAITPLEGGTISLAFRVQAHPDSRAFGALCTLVQQDVEVTIEAGE